MLQLRTLGICAATAAIGGTALPALADAVWSADGSRSAVSLSVSHLLVSKINGTMPIASATVVTDDGALVPQLVDVVLDSAALTTQDAKRDADLRSDRFFDATRYPTISFESRRVTETGPLTFTVEGALTMRGVSRPISFDTHIGGLRVEGGKRRVRYEAIGRFRRSEFGMTYARRIVGDVVTLDVVIEAVSESAVSPARR